MNTEQTPPVSADALRFEEEISQLAQKYYDEEGRPEGRDKEHWHRAEQEIRSRDGQPSDSTSSAPESGTVP
jgi:hypothetical protein